MKVECFLILCFAAKCCCVHGRSAQASRDNSLSSAAPALQRPGVGLDKKSGLMSLRARVVRSESSHHDNDNNSVAGQQRNPRTEDTIIAPSLLLESHQKNDEQRMLAHDDDNFEEDQVRSDEEDPEADDAPSTSCTMCPPNEGWIATPSTAPSSSILVTPHPTSLGDDDRRPTSGHPPYTQDWTYKNSGIDFLVAAFFFIAAGWLILALLYSILVLIVVRLRARGELDIYDEHFGRLYLIGRHCYIPLGCILRRYVVALSEEETSSPVRIMTREERRLAMEELLGRGPVPTTAPLDRGEEEPLTGEPNVCNVASATAEEPNLGETPEVNASNSAEETAPTTPTSATSGGEETKQDDDLAWLENNEPVCSICLMEYEDGEEEDVFGSNVCQHEFHKVCLLDWLERRNNTECPVCRTALVSDEDVWEVVQRRRKSYRESNRSNYCCLPCCCGDSSTSTRDQDGLHEDDYRADIEMGDQSQIIDPSVLFAADTSLHRHPDQAENVEEVQQQQQEDVAGLTGSNLDTPLAQTDSTEGGDKQNSTTKNGNTLDAGQAATHEETKMKNVAAAKDGGVETG